MHKKRISDRNIFWLGILVVIFLSHYFLYIAIGRYLPRGLEGIWVFLGLLAMASSIAARRLSAPNRRARRMSLQSAIHRFGGCWNIFVVLTTVFMLVAWLCSRWIPVPRLGAYVVSIALALAVCTYGVLEAGKIRRTTLRLAAKNLPDGVDGLRIVQLSDLHVGPFMNLKHVARVVDAIVQAHPDLVVITGDLVDGLVGENGTVLPFYRPFADRLRRIKNAAPRLGVWAVPGNHDFYEGFENSMDFIKRAGIVLLQDEYVDLGEVLLVGVDDLSHLRQSYTTPGKTESEELIASLPEDSAQKFVLLLRHRPVVEPDTIGRFHLQLSGHTHGGQLFFLPSSHHKIPGRPNGFRSLGRDSYLYVSNGAGFVGPPMRFLAPAEIVIIDLYNDRASSGDDIPVSCQPDEKLARV